MRLRLSESDLSPALTELLLFSLNKKSLHKEIIDLCQSSEDKKGGKSDILNYYLGESIMRGQLSGKTYTEALRDCGVYASDGQDLSAC